MAANSQSSLRQTRHVFVSYRSSRRDLAIRISDAVKAFGWIADTVEEDLKCPFPSGSAHEFKWLTDRISSRIEPRCTFIMMVSDDAQESHWVLWEGLEGFGKAYRVIVCWLSGTDPLKLVFPLAQIAYRVIESPQSFIVDARADPNLAVTAVARILNPSRSYRVILRLQQGAIVLVGIAMAIWPVTVLLATSVLPTTTAGFIRSVLLRQWVCSLSLWLSIPMIGIFYPSYGGPSRIAPDRIDGHIRLITPGFTGLRWSRIIFPASFMLACAIDGIRFLSLDSMAAIGRGTYIKAAIIGVISTLCYDRFCWNLYTMHVGATYRRLKKHYGLDDAV